MKKQYIELGQRQCIRLSVGIVLAVGMGDICAVETEISNVPPFIAKAVKPNIMFLMDNSGSMDRTWLPDQSHYWQPKTALNGVRIPTGRAFWPNSPDPKYLSYGHYSRHCNHMAYNPSAVYTPPINLDTGEPEAAASVADFNDPNYRPFYFVYNTNIGKNNPMAFEFKDDGSVVQWDNMFWRECNSIIGTAPGSAVFNTVWIKDSPDPWVRQNFQNWLAYYSDRRGMMKAAVKQAFFRLSSKYRVGFSLTSAKTAQDNSKAKSSPNWDFLDIVDFKKEQKVEFFKAIDRSDGTANTPLRGALSKIGRYYANKAPGQKNDPLQQSCQRNFAVLAADGGWTKGGESGTFTALTVDGQPLTSVDSAGDVKKPFRDSGQDKIVSLADVAYYYYNTDLRVGEASKGNCRGAKGVDVCKNNVKGVAGTAHESFGDSATHQHMTTFTIGLGLNGKIAYHKDYREKKSAAFNDIVDGYAQWTTMLDPTSNDIMPLSHTDDFWHTAVNGRGQFFSASDPATLVESLHTTLSMISATDGAASAATPTSNQPVALEDKIYVSSFVSQKWTGDVLAYDMDEDGKPQGKPKSAKSALDSMADPGSRNIFYGKPGSTTPQKFTASNLERDGLGSKFSNFCKKPGAGGDKSPIQCLNLTPQQQDEANSAANLVSYLSGNHNHAYYRKRESRLGDIVNGQLAYISEKPNFPYSSDAGYSAYRATSRKPLVLAPANDGMLHAFNPGKGKDEDLSEVWAFVPNAVMHHMYKLADFNYPDNHSYLVDGTPQIGDVYDGVKWRTIVVGGFNAGGKGYYALDLTEPEVPKFLWEFKHDNMGLSFGNPIITKRKNGQWVVMFASGYNNIPSESGEKGDGNGYLFVLDALSGKEVVNAIPTLNSGKPVGSKTVPSGLAKINVWVNSDSDNTLERVYGGDLLGNVWRFDIDNKVEPHGQALLLAQLRDPAGAAQPVTTRPILAELKAGGDRHPMVYVGTGRSLGENDVDDTQTQSIYAFKDTMTNVGQGDLRSKADRARGGMQQHTITGTAFSRSVSAKSVDLAKDIGWFVDFPEGGERVDVNPAIALDKLYVAGNLPAAETCQAGGSSFVYQFDLKSGRGKSSYDDDALVQGLTLTQMTSGKNKGSITTNVRYSDGSLDTIPDDGVVSPRELKRSAWRLLGH